MASKIEGAWRRQPLYNAWLENMGKPTGVGETMLGYFVVILAAWLIAALITRRLGHE